MGVLSDPRTAHRYQTRRDEDCARFACRVYQEGYRVGYGAGVAEARAIGYAEGHADGYAEGAASAGK